MLITLGIGLLILVVVWAFNPRRGEDSWTRVTTFTGVVPTGTAPRIGHSAPDFTLPLLDESTFTLSEQRGSPVWLNFWATWCLPCRVEMPDIQEVWEEVSKKGVVLLTINLAEDPITAAEYAFRGGFTFPVGFDLRGQVSTEYRLAGLPTHFFIDRHGIVREIRVGLLTAAGMRKHLEKLASY